MGLAVVSSTHWWGWMDAGPQPGWRLGILLAAVLFACFAAQALRPTLQGSTINIAVTLLGVLYIPFLCCFYIGLDHLRTGGTGAVLFVIFVAKSGDIGGYTAGRIFGGLKLAPVISPNKTIAGAVGGLTLSTIVGILAGRFLAGLSIPSAVLGGILVGASAQLGDLCESMIKRDLEVKDAGNKLPGFGGVLDLLDCLLTAAPAGYLFFAL
jgi:phosphatidate cytidylyltransferase